MKKDKNTALQFGGLIDTYTIDQAVDDKAVVPLLYEGRHTVQEVQERPIDSWFDRAPLQPSSGALRNPESLSNLTIARRTRDGH